MDKTTNYTRRKKQDSYDEGDALARAMGSVPPQAIDIENAVLGAVIVDESSADYVLGELRTESFYDRKNRVIFDAIKELHEEHVAIDLLTLTNKLKAKGKLEEIGGAIKLADLSSAVGSASHVEYHVNILKQKAIQRGLIAASYEIQKMAFDESFNVDDLMIESQEKVFGVLQQNLRSQTANMKDMLNDVLDIIQKRQNGEGSRGVITGYAELDRISMGWQPGNLIVIGARPGIGKTAIALNLASNAAFLGHTPVAFFSLEMTKEEIITRVIESETEICGDKIKGQSRMDQNDWAQLESKLSSIMRGSDFYIDDTPAITTTEFVAKAKNLVATKGIGLIVIDYLQLMKNPGSPNVREEVSEVSHKLKAAAKDMKVPIIALAQLNRQVSQRDGGLGKPILSDIKESGAIEQDADIVMFLHRPDQMGLSEDPSMKEYAEIIVAKNRNGAVRTIPMIYKESIVKFKEPTDSLQFQAVQMSSRESRMNDYNPFDY